MRARPETGKQHQRGGIRQNQEEVVRDRDADHLGMDGDRLEQGEDEDRATQNGIQLPAMMATTTSQPRPAMRSGTKRSE